MSTQRSVKTVQTAFVRERKASWSQFNIKNKPLIKNIAFIEGSDFEKENNWRAQKVIRQSK